MRCIRDVFQNIRSKAAKRFKIAKISVKGFKNKII